MGSCFAVEIRQALRQRGLPVLPDLARLDSHFRQLLTYMAPNGLAPLTAPIADRYVLQWYFTATIRQEIERAFGLWRQEDDDVWFARGIWQDPYRRSLFSRSQDQLIRFIRALDQLMVNAIEAADLYVLTLGLTEAWRKKQSPLFVAQCPGVRPDQRGVRDTFLQRLDYGDCLGDLVRVCELILKRWPHKHLVVTVSPVALHRTFTAADHSVANCESKSILRAAAGELAHQFDHVHYFHSYEMCLLNPPQTVLEGDGRHIQRSFIDEIVTTFLDQFGSQTLHRLLAEQAPPASGARPAHLPIPQ